MFRKFNKDSSKFTTEHLHLSGPATPIFISENLTSKMKRLFYLAREAAKAKDYKFCWVSHGKIFVRRRENGPLVRFLSEADLEKLVVPK
ncbi:Zinc finger DNA binding protein [Operophtera brumata]|uniref:Zinc finger DNA binding protein n=1 Tax=Operophtera brumata TaxID=104452 RepID=A0A0L7KPI5_OPEBR|nr:Zinc finger DNA binding protein [Operophtera brumata]